VLAKTSAGEKPRMHVKQAVDRDRLRSAELDNRPRHRVDVAEHLVGCDIDIGLPCRARGFGT